MGDYNRPHDLVIEGPLQDLSEFDRTARNTKIDVTYPILIPEIGPEFPVRATHTPGDSIYRFMLTPPDYEALEGRPMRTHRLTVKPGLGQASLYVTRSVVGGKTNTEELRDFYASLHGLNGLHVPNDMDKAEFIIAFRGLYMRLIK